MSRFLVKKHHKLVPYTPGEQIRQDGLIKLNTNESPFSPPEQVVRYASEAAGSLQLYCDPDAGELREKLAEHLGLEADQVLVTNGSDEILHFAFMAFCDEERPAVFPDITYGFYQVFADLEGVDAQVIPLKGDLSVDPADYMREGTVFLANPNANTGIALSPAQIEKIVAADPDRVVVVDEAYVDFGAGTVLPLIEKYDNLLVSRTFSKAWSMAGARLGFGMGSRELIEDLNRIKYSTDPYNVNSMTQAAGLGALESCEEIRSRCDAIVSNRSWLTEELGARGFEMTPSQANFVFARHTSMGGREIYERLKEENILVRHFDKPRIRDYIRITIGSRDQLDRLLEKLDEILKEE